MRKLAYLVLVAVLACSIVSCEKRKTHTLRDDARSLYNNSLVIISKYADSISHAKDSATLISIMQRFDESLTELNYSYAAGADYEISEGENDTLTNMSLKIIVMRDSLLKAYAKKFVEEGDSAITLISQEEQSN